MLYCTYAKCMKLVCAYTFYESFQKLLFRTCCRMYLIVVPALNQHDYRAQAHQLDFL